MMGGIWIGGDYIPCHKVTTYFCSFEEDKYYYGDNNYSIYSPIPAWEKKPESFEPMKHAAPEKLVSWRW